MVDVWFTSDTHFDHKLVAELRGFDAVRFHDNEIIERWNSVVKPRDIVWHLGDVGMGPLSRFADSLDQLNGELHLIAGNHDECSPIHRGAHKRLAGWHRYFETVQAFARRRILGEEVLLSHYPYEGDHTHEDRYARYRFRDDGLAFLLHGHTHSEDRQSKLGRQIHVGMDAWDLAPVNLEHIQDVVRFSEAGRGL